MAHLPPPLLLAVLSYLSDADANSASSASREFRDVALHSGFWERRFADAFGSRRKPAQFSWMGYFAFEMRSRCS